MVNLNQNQFAGILGAALLISGVFAPIFSSPVKGQIDYFRYSETEAAIILALAALALTLSILRKYTLISFLGIGVCATLALAFIKFQLFVSGAATRWMGKFADSEYDAINRLTQESFALDWGWGPLICGAVLLLAAGRLKGYSMR